jgi:hypothetical protein
MAINVSFNGATILKPGAYSKISIDLSGGFPLGPTGLVAIFGESTRGKSGSDETDISKNVFTANQIAQVREKYGSGPIVDAMNFLFSPASDGAIPNGAQAVYVYKTNSSSRASLALDTSYGTVRSLEYGIGGNTITYSASENYEMAPSETSSAAFDETAIVGGSFDVYLDGSGPTNVAVAAVPAGAGSAAAFAAAVDSALPAGMSAAEGAGSADGACIIEISIDADPAASQRGKGRAMELQESSGTPLAEMGISTGLSVSTMETSMLVTIKQTRDLIEESSTIGGNIVMSAGYDGAATTASIEVTDSSDLLYPNRIVLRENGSVTADFAKAAYDTLLQLVNAINLTADWSVSLSSTLYNSLSPSVLDIVSADTLASSGSGLQPARIKKDADEAADFFSLSSIVDITGQSSTGLMDAKSETALSGGSLGSTSTASITAALSEFEEIRVNSIVPLFSRDSADDIADGLTESSSSYSILGIHQSVKSHLSLMSTTKNRSERQGYLSYKASFSDALDQASLLADQRIQLCIQDIRNVDSVGAIKWFQPWAQSCMLAGARGGSPVGTPLTFKFFNTVGIRHTAQPMSTPEEDITIDFNPNDQFEQAISGGITFFESPQSGGIRCVVDNTTYQKDANWVYNRGNVMYAADILAFDFRNQLENIFVGAKNNIQASEVKSVAASILGTFLAQGITVATADAPNGYKQLDVQIDGNIIRINVVAVLVEGIDFHNYKSSVRSIIQV